MRRSSFLHVPRTVAITLCAIALFVCVCVFLLGAFLFCCCCFPRRIGAIKWVLQFDEINYPSDNTLQKLFHWKTIARQPGPRPGDVVERVCE